MALTKADSDVINIPSISVALQSDATAGGIGVLKANLNSPTFTGTPVVPTISSDTLDLSNGSILNVEALNDIFTTKKYLFNSFTRTQIFDYEDFNTYPSVTDFYRANSNDLYLGVGQKEVTPTNTVINSYIYYYNVTSSAFEEIQIIETNNVSDLDMYLTDDNVSVMAVINYIDGADLTSGKYTVDSYVYRRNTVNDTWFAGYARTSKTACVVATTANITLSGTQTIDGVAVVAGNRVLVKDQTTTSANGIYVVAAGAWTRATDADTAAELTVGTYTTITSGTVHTNDLFIVTTQPTTLGTDPVVFTEVCNKIATVGASDCTFFDASVGANTLTYLAIVNHKDADTGTTSNVKIYEWNETTDRFGSQAIDPAPIQTITLNGAYSLYTFTYSGNRRLLIIKNMYSFNGTTTLSSDNCAIVYKWNTSTGVFDTGTTIPLVGDGITSKTACVVATTANITLSGTQTIDGVAVVAGNRVLVKNQTTTSANGIYVVAAGAWTRATDADTAAELAVGTYTYITSGTENGNKVYVVTTAPTTLGTDPVTFTLTKTDGGQLNTARAISISGTTYFITGANQYGQCEMYTYNDTTFTYYTSLNSLDTVGVHLFGKNGETFAFMSKGEPAAASVNSSGFSTILKLQASPVAFRIRSGFAANILMKSDLFTDTTIIDPITGQSTMFLTQHTRSGAQRLGIYKAIYY